LEIRKGKLLKNGKTKKLFATNNDDLLIMAFKNDIPVEGKREIYRGKNIGRYSNSISGIVFKFLENYHIRTHFMDIHKPGEMTVKKLDMLPITVWIWNGASGSLCRRYGLDKGKDLESPIVEYYWKNEALHNPSIHFDHASALGLVRQSVILEMDKLAKKINAVLKDFFARRNLRVADFALEFGLLNSDIVLGDEISPDTCRVWDVGMDGVTDIHRFQIGKRDPEEIWSEWIDRIEIR
jgi:phosphoribosylaminoimidazole-succinocarboxamide synthase